MNEETSLKNRRINNFMYVIVFFIVLLGSIYLIGGVFFDNEYSYKNKETGEKFPFTTREINDELTMHKLTTYTVFQGIGHIYDTSFRNGPKELEDLFIEDDVRKKIISKEKLFITINPELDAKAVLATVEVGRVVGNAEWGIFKIPTEVATTVETGTSRPVKTCKSTSSRIGVILFRIGETTSVTSEDECIIVEGKDSDELIKAADKLAYTLLNVLPSN